MIQITEEQLTQLLAKCDPIGIAFVDEAEYDLEAKAIYPKLSSCSSEGDVLKLVYEVFVEYFDESLSGPQEDYKSIATEIWNKRFM